MPREHAYRRSFAVLNKSIGVASILAKADEEKIKVWKLLDMKQMPSFVHEKLAVIGDAAHPFLPHQGWSLVITTLDMHANLCQARVEDKLLRMQHLSVLYCQLGLSHKKFKSDLPSTTNADILERIKYKSTRDWRGEMHTSSRLRIGSLIVSSYRSLRRTLQEANR